MNHNSGRLFAGFAALAVLWISVYWWWEPRERPVSGLVEPVSNTTTEPPAPAIAEPPSPAPPRPHPIVTPDPPPTRGVVVQPRYKQYTIRADDTFESIARREWGSSSLYTAIAAANPFVDPTRLTVGKVINIPLDPGNIQGKIVVPRAPAAPTGDPAPAAVPDPPVAEPAVIEYTIRGGDSLSKISKVYYGSTRYADFLFEHNRERLGLTDKDAIRAGQTLLIPPKPVD